MNENERFLCCLCDVEMEARKTTLNYLGHAFSTSLLRCPRCGQVYIPEELASGKMAEVEMQLEEK